MGKTYQPTYTVTLNDDPALTFAWSTKNCGAPTDKSLAKFADVMTASTRPGGCNEQIPELAVRTARVQYNGTNIVVATYPARSDEGWKSDPSKKISFNEPSLPTKHHPDCSCAVCYYGDDAYKFNFKASEY